MSRVLKEPWRTGLHITNATMKGGEASTRRECRATVILFFAEFGRDTDPASVHN